MSSIPKPNWSPSPYVFSDLSFENLPKEAQNFLVTHDLYPPKNYDTDAVNLIRQSRARKLYRTVEGVHGAIVMKRRELASMNANDIPWDELDNLEESPCSPENRCKYLLLEVVTILYPELCNHLNDFMLDMDALVWLDVYVRLGTPDAVHPKLVDEYRTLKSQPVLDSSFNALAQLDVDVLRMNFHRLEVEREEALMRAMQKIQNTPPPVYLEELEEEAQFVVVPNAPLVDEKSRGRRMSIYKDISGLQDSFGCSPIVQVL